MHDDCYCCSVYTYKYVVYYTPHKHTCTYTWSHVENSPLVDAGVSVPPYTDGHVGAAPDIGAYERGGDRWVAGCVGLDGCMDVTYISVD